MAESVFRIVYGKPRDGGVLSNLDIGEVSFNGEALSDVARVVLNIVPDGTPKLRIERARQNVSPVLDNIHIDGYAKVEIVTE